MRRDTGADASVSGVLHATTGRRVSNAITAVAPPAVVQTLGTDLVASPSVQAFPGPVTKGNLLLVMLSLSNGATRSVSDSQGNSWTEVAHVGQSGVGDTTMFWAKAGATGADTVTITASAGQITALLYEVSGIPGATPVDQSGVNNGGGSTNAVGVAFTGLAGTQDFVIEWAVYVPAGNTPTGGIWTNDFSATIAGQHFVGAAWAVTGPNVAAPTLNPGTNESYALSAVAFKQN